MASNDAAPPPSYESVAAKKAPPSPNRPPHHNDDAASISSSDSGGAPYDSTVTNQARASMEDQARDLPPGWARFYDRNSGHHFYVDTEAENPESYWKHPYELPQFAHLAPPNDIGRLQRANTERQQAAIKENKLKHLGRKLKDMLTHTTHEERVKARALEAEREREAQRKYALIREAYREADQTGRRVLIGKDRNTGQDVYAEPSGMGGMYGGGGMGPGMGMGMGMGGGYGGPYGRGYAGPLTPYSRRPAYGGYRGAGGAGMGLPLFGGLMGGMLLGDMMF